MSVASKAQVSRLTLLQFTGTDILKIDCHTVCGLADTPTEGVKRWTESYVISSSLAAYLHP